MPIGTQITVTIYCTSSGSFGGVESVNLTKFNHPAGFTTTSSVKRIDVANSSEDRYVVSTNWASDDAAIPIFTPSSEPSSPPITSVTTLTSDAITKINTAFPGTFI